MWYYRIECKDDGDSFEAAIQTDTGDKMVIDRFFKKEDFEKALKVFFSVKEKDES